MPVRWHDQGAASLRVLIFGGGGHAKVVHDVVAATPGAVVAGFVDTRRPDSGTLLGKPVWIEDEFASGACVYDALAVAIGDNFVREAVFRRVRSIDPAASFPSFRHPSAIIAEDVAIGEGSVAMPRVVVNRSARIGRFCILNTGTIVEHDCQVDDFASISPAATIGAACRIGRYSLLGIGSSVRHGIVVGENVVLGGGGALVRDAAANAVYVGTPAHWLKSRELGERML